MLSNIKLLSLCMKVNHLTTLKDKVMKAITEKETLNNRFCKTDKKTNKVTLTKVSRKQAEKMDIRTLCLYIASDSLRFRSVAKATENANRWLAEGDKEKIVSLFFE